MAAFCIKQCTCVCDIGMHGLCIDCGCSLPFYASEMNGSPWLALNLFGPGGVIIILLLVNKPEQKAIKPERFTAELENAQAVTASVQAWMEKERFTTIHTE